MNKNRMNIPANFEAPDDFYSAFVNIHDSLTDEQSDRFNLALIFMLANQVGSRDTLQQLLAEAEKFTRSFS